MDIQQDCMAERELGRTVWRAEVVVAKVEEQYPSGNAVVGGKGTGQFGMDRENIASAILGLDGKAAVVGIR